jgi:hypothetical protein
VRVNRHGPSIALCAGGCILLASTGLAGARVGRSAQAAADYGGGAIATSYSRRDEGTFNVTLRPAADGRRVLVYGHALARCGRHPTIGGGLTYSLPLDASGAFAGSDLQSFGPRRRRETDRVAITGRIDGARATGSLRVLVTRRRPGKSTLRCDSGTLTWQARAAAVPAGEAPVRPAPGAAFFGTTATRLPGYSPFGFLLRVSADGSRVEVGSVGVFERCRRGGRRAPLHTYDDYVPGAPIAADATFRSEETFSEFAGHRETVVVTGRFSTTGVSGTYRAHATFRARHGPATRCDSGEVPWSAVP